MAENKGGSAEGQGGKAKPGEHRAYPRIDSINLVSYSQYDPDRVLMHMGMGSTLDLSEGGMKLECAESLPVPTDLEIGFTMGGEIVRVQARVVYAEEKEEGRCIAGIRFLDISDEDLAKLHMYLEKKTEP
jgi:hypothetical protein